jgi:hypothetical protein
MSPSNLLRQVSDAPSLKEQVGGVVCLSSLLVSVSSLLLLASSVVLAPSLAWGLSTFDAPWYLLSSYGPNHGLKDALLVILEILTGEAAQVVSFLGMVIVLYGIMVRARRGEPIQGLATVGVSFILISNVRDLVNFVGFDYSMPARMWEYADILRVVF